jgi:hypothetical protein
VILQYLILIRKWFPVGLEFLMLKDIRHVNQRIMLLISVSVSTGPDIIQVITGIIEPVLVGHTGK